METTMPQKLNKIQLHLLQMFNFTTSTDELNDLKKVLVDYYSKKADEEMDKFWDENDMNQDKLIELSQKHIRTKYNRK